ncbi:hypothetical protein AZ78_4426 [Lysobacter capsici AZ78]|uniref:Uncharacterized protein n=1 Tax=Lysobacter capsici AZ78 TaxID=1444315 RepID=A0A108UCR2_9GAMM|nr:hypothetical protein AZ78_4426 [Lysobacter capsici AZ78]
MTGLLCPRPPAAGVPVAAAGRGRGSGFSVGSGWVGSGLEVGFRSGCGRYESGERTSVATLAIR